MDDTWDFDQVLKVFNSQLTAREKCYFVGKSENVAKNEFKQKPFLATAATLTTNEKKNSLQCIFCNQPHKAWNCNIVTDVNMRRKIVIEQKRCLNCLRKNHVAKECPSKFSCYKCQSKHNTCMCEVTNDSSMTTAQAVIDEQTLTAMVNLSPGDESVLLKAAIVSVSKMTDDECCRGRLLFDDASSRSYITKKLMKN